MMRVTSLQVGVALYANAHPDDQVGNWACEYNKEPFSFMSASDLPGQTLWITNCQFGDLKQFGLNLNPKIADEGYFRTRIKQIVTELGLSQYAPDQQASFLVSIIGNALEMMKRQLNLIHIPANSLAQAVGHLFGVREGAPNSALLQVSELACQRYTQCERERRLEKVEIFPLWFHRVDWARDLLTQPLPASEDIRVIPPASLPSSGQDVALLVKWAQENNLPLFARIKINALESTVGRLLNYGAGASALRGETFNGASYETRNMREWCALPELAVLAGAGEVEVLEVAISNGWMRTPVKVLDTKASSVSYSYGLVAENLWVGITRRHNDYRQSRTLTTAWIQSIDRMRCLLAAEKLIEHGMDIANYGYGRVTVVCPQSVKANVPQIARELGMLYPASLEGITHLPPNPNNPAEIVQTLLANRDYASFARVDQIVLQGLQNA